MRLVCYLPWQRVSSGIGRNWANVNHDVEAAGGLGLLDRCHCARRTSLLYMAQNMSTKHPQRTEVVVPYDPTAVRAETI